MVTVIALCAAGGVLVGGIAGFVVAVLQLQAKRYRNGRLARLGRPPLRDCVLVNWHLPCAMVGGVLSGALATWLRPSHAIAIGSLAAPGALCLLVLGVVTTQAVGKR